MRSQAPHTISPLYTLAVPFVEMSAWGMKLSVFAAIASVLCQSVDGRAPTSAPTSAVTVTGGLSETATALCETPFRVGFPDVSEAELGPSVNASTCAAWAAFRGATAWCMDDVYLNDLAAAGSCYLYVSTFHPNDQVNPDANWLFCDRQGVTSVTAAPTTPGPTVAGETFTPTSSPTAQATDFGEQANALCAAGYQVGHPDWSNVQHFEAPMNASECAASAAHSDIGATAWIVDNEFLVDLTRAGCAPLSGTCGRSQYCQYTTAPFDPADPSDVQTDDDITAGDYWVFCDLTASFPPTAPISLEPQLECGAVVAETAAATGTVAGARVLSFPFTVADATPNLTFSTCGSRHAGSSFGGGTSLRLLKPMPDGSFEEVVRCDDCGDCGGSAALGFYPYNATHLRPHFNPAVFDLGLVAGVAPTAAGFCPSGERQQFELGSPTRQYDNGTARAGFEVRLDGLHTLSSCASHPAVLASYGWSTGMNCLQNLSDTCRCYKYTASFLRPGIISMSGSVRVDGRVGGLPDEAFRVYCEADKNVGAWEREAWFNPWVDEQLCRTGSARRFRAGYPGVNELEFDEDMTGEECLGNVTNLTAHGLTVYGWSFWNEDLVPQGTCTDTAAAGAEDAAGNNCSAYVDYTCSGEALDLPMYTSPMTATVAASDGTNNRYRSSCGGAGGERIFSAALAPGGTISIKHWNIGDECNRLDSVHETRWGGGCPGENLVQCTDNPERLGDPGSIVVHSWTNDQTTTETVFFMVSAFDPTGFGAGVADRCDLMQSFTIEWNITDADTMPTSSDCTAHGDEDFDAEETCCACGGGTVSLEHSGHLDTCYYYDEPFLPHAPEHHTIFDDTDDSGDFWVYCETDENLGAVNSRVIDAGEYILQLETARWDATEGDTFRLEMTCDTRGPTVVPTSPTGSPTTSDPTLSPSISPTTSDPTTSHSVSPASSDPTASPTFSPTTSDPTLSPSTSPTTPEPTEAPSTGPTMIPPSGSPTQTRTPIDQTTDNASEGGSTAAILVPLLLLFCIGATIMVALFRRNSHNKERHRFEASEASAGNDPKAIACLNPEFAPPAHGAVPVAQRAQAATATTSATSSNLPSLDQTQNGIDSGNVDGATGGENSYLKPQQVGSSAARDDDDDTYAVAIDNTYAAPVYDDNLYAAPVDDDSTYDIAGDTDRPNSYLLPQNGNAASNVYADPYLNPRDALQPQQTGSSAVGGAAVYGDDTYAVAGDAGRPNSYLLPQNGNAASNVYADPYLTPRDPSSPAYDGFADHAPNGERMYLEVATVPDPHAPVYTISSAPTTVSPGNYSPGHAACADTNAARVPAVGAGPTHFVVLHEDEAGGYLQTPSPLSGESSVDMASAIVTATPSAPALVHHSVADDAQYEPLGKRDPSYDSGPSLEDSYATAQSAGSTAHDAADNTASRLASTLMVQYEDADNTASRPASDLYATADALTRKSAMVYAEAEYAEVDYSAAKDAPANGSDEATYELIDEAFKSPALSVDEQGIRLASVRRTNPLASAAGGNLYDASGLPHDTKGHDYEYLPTTEDLPTSAAGGALSDASGIPPDTKGHDYEYLPTSLDLPASAAGLPDPRSLAWHSDESRATSPTRGGGDFHHGK